MSDAPRYIWLQWIPSDIPNNDEITWCSDPIHEDDTAYVREDVAEAQQADLVAALGFVRNWLDDDFEDDVISHTNIVDLFDLIDKALADTRKENNG